MTHARNCRVRRWAVLGALLVSTSARVLAGTPQSINVHVTVTGSPLTHTSPIALIDDIYAFYNGYVDPNTINPQQSGAKSGANVGDVIKVGFTGGNPSATTADTTVQAGVVDMYFTIDCTGGASQQQSQAMNYTATLKNSTPLTINWVATKDSNGQVMGSGTLPGGAVSSWTYGGGGPGFAFHITEKDQSGNVLGSWAIGANDPGWSTTPAPPSGITSTDNGGFVQLTNPLNNVGWNDNLNQAALDSTLKTGFNDLLTTEAAGWNQDAGFQSQIAAALSGINATLGNFQSANHTDLGNVDGAVNGLSSGITGVQNQVSAFQAANHADLANVQGAVNGLGTWIGQGNTMLGTLNNDLINVIGPKLDSQYNEMASVVAAVNAANSSIQGGNSYLAQIANNTAQTASGVNNINSSLAFYMSPMMSSLADIDNKTAAPIDYTPKFNTLDQDIQNLNNSDAAKLTTLHNDTSQFANQNHTDLATISAQLSSLLNQSAIDTRPNLNQIDADLNTFATANNQNLIGIGGKLDTANQHLQDLEALTNLGPKIDQVGTNVLNLPVNTYNYAVGKLNGQQFDAAGAQANASLASSGTRDQLNTAASYFGNLHTTEPNNVGSSLVMTIPGFGTIDCNPLDYPDIAALFDYVHRIFTWLITVFYVFAMYKVGEQYLIAATHVPQARTAGTAILGVNLNVGSAAAMAAAISVVIAAIPAVWLSWVASRGGNSAIAIFISDPLAFATGHTYEAVSLVCKVVPVGLAITDLSLYWAFRLGFGSVYFVTQALIRALVGL